MCVYVEGQVGSGVRGCIYLAIVSEAGADAVNAFAVVLFELTYVCVRVVVSVCFYLDVYACLRNRSREVCDGVGRRKGSTTKGREPALLSVSTPGTESLKRMAGVPRVPYILYTLYDCEGDSAAAELHNLYIIMVGSKAEEHAYTTPSLVSR